MHQIMVFYLLSSISIFFSNHRTIWRPDMNEWKINYMKMEGESGCDGCILVEWNSKNVITAKKTWKLSTRDVIPPTPRFKFRTTLSVPIALVLKLSQQPELHIVIFYFFTKFPHSICTSFQIQFFVMKLNIS